jgi:RNA polymerase sigma-70 factor, ECF subfamily
MTRLENPAQVQDEGAKDTLGELLYANGVSRAPSEAQWVAWISAIGIGDQRAFEALYQRTHRIVFTLIMRILADKRSAEEVTLDVFHDVWRNALRYESQAGPVLGWILNQARSRSLDRLRFERRKKRLPTSQADGMDTNAGDAGEEQVEREQRSRLLRHALAVLQPAERESIETAFFRDLSYPEVALLLNEPVGTVKTRIRTGLRKLRFALWNGITRP